AEGAPASAAKALSLGTGGVQHVRMAIDAAVTPTSSERAAIDRAFDAARLSVEALLSKRQGSTLTPNEMGRLSATWSDLWAAIDAAFPAGARQELALLSIR